MKYKHALILLIVMLSMVSSSSFSQVIKGTFAIKNVENGMLLRVKDANKTNGTPLVAYTPVNWKCVTWDFKHVEGKTYQLQNLFTSKTFQPVQKASPGTALEQQPISPQQPSQQYEFIPVEKNVYLIKLKDTDLYVTPSDAEGAVNSAIMLEKKKNTKNQYWTLYEQHPTM